MLVITLRSIPQATLGRLWFLRTTDTAKDTAHKVATTIQDEKSIDKSVRMYYRCYACSPKQTGISFAFFFVYVHVVSKLPR